MKIVDPHSMQVEGNINQAESSELRIGQSVSVGLDAFPGTELKGKVYSIGALAVGGWRQQYFVRNVPVRIAIEQFDARVIPDLSAFGDVQMERIGNVVQVPLGAIHEDGGKSFLFVRAGDGFDRRAVTLGPRNNTSVAITSGVNTGDEVRVN
jgi:multidrug efflux pump subunit AcrA (membrane-fusion protein)